MSSPGRALVVRTNGPDETHAVGMALARSFAGAVFVSLEGPLGSGKTVLVRGVCEGLGVRGPVTSPTYTLQNEYDGDEGRRVIHMDCFRLEGATDLEALGMEDRLGDDSVVLIEWGEKVLDALPPETVRIRIEPSGETERCLHVHIPNGVNIEGLGDDS